MRELEAGLDAGVLGAARAVAQLAPLVLLLGWMAPRLALVAALVFGVFSLALGRARRAWKRANERAARHREALLGAADEAVRHAELWTTYGAEARVRAHLDGIGRALANQGARIEASASGLSGANEVLGALALVLAIAAGRAGWLGGTRGGEGIEQGVLLPFAVTFFLAYRPIRDATDARLALARARVAAESLAPLFAAAERGDAEDDESAHEPDAAGTSRASAPTRLWTLAPLELDGLKLARGVAGELSVRVPAGTVLAIVGGTGSGKTTLLRVLLGLEAPRSGAIRYGAIPLEALPSGPASRPFAWVPQDAPVLADTLDANVALAPSSDAPRAALDAIGAGSLASSVGDARLGAGGRALSGGERQWVALARAVATRLPVLLLDEPTSGLDPVSQARVLQAIARLKGLRTVILVTHREEPRAIADAVLRLGSVAGRGGAWIADGLGDRGARGWGASDPSRRAQRARDSGSVASMNRLLLAFAALAVAACGGAPSSPAVTPTRSVDAPASSGPRRFQPPRRPAGRDGKSALVAGQSVPMDGVAEGLAWPALRAAVNRKPGDHAPLTIGIARDVPFATVMRAVWTLRDADIRLQTPDAAGATRVLDLRPKPDGPTRRRVPSGRLRRPEWRPSDRRPGRRRGPSRAPTPPGRSRARSPPSGPSLPHPLRRLRRRDSADAASGARCSTSPGPSIATSPRATRGTCSASPCTSPRERADDVLVSLPRLTATVNRLSRRSRIASAIDRNGQSLATFSYRFRD